MEPPTGDYFEGILQLRPATEELLNWVREQIKKDGKARIAKEKMLKEGADLYITDQHYLQSFGKKLKEHQPGILKTSTRLHTMNKMTSRHVYRITVLFKPFEIRKRQIITYQGEEFEVLQINGQVILKNTKSGKKKTVKLERLVSGR